jgi:hypothetical protein
MYAGWGQGSTGGTILLLCFFFLVNQGKVARVAYCGTYMQLGKTCMYCCLNRPMYSGRWMCPQIISYA